MNTIHQIAKGIRCLISDVDGVLTDARLYMDNFGNEQKAFNVQDGMGLKLLMAADIEVAVITTSRSALIDHRMKQLDIRHFYKGQVEKETAYEALKLKLNLPDSAFAYIGDDLPDIPLIQRVGLGVAVANAVSEVKKIADYETKSSGGYGAVRELCDLILYSQGKFESALARYLKP